MSGLAQKRVVVTRPAHQAEDLVLVLKERQAQVVRLPTIEIMPPSESAPIRAAAKDIARYDWIIFASANAVEGLSAYLTKARSGARVAAVGEATRAAAERLGWTVDAVPPKFTAESLAQFLPDHEIEGRRILIPAASIARQVLPETLRKRGAVVDLVEAYRTEKPPDLEAAAREVFHRPDPPDWVTFTSPSSFENLISAIERAALEHSRIACIGPTTRAAIRNAGLPVAVEPEQHTVAAMVAAMAAAAY